MTDLHHGSPQFLCLSALDQTPDPVTVGTTLEQGRVLAEHRAQLVGQQLLAKHRAQTRVQRAEMAEARRAETAAETSFHDAADHAAGQ